MMNKIILLLCSSLSVLAFVSCKKESKIVLDETLPAKPVIEIVSVKPSVGESMVCGSLDIRTVSLSSGSVFQLDFNLKAREGLSQYKIDLHHNFDCHTHRVAARAGAPWKVLKIIDLVGHQQLIKESLLVPTDAIAGNYHFMLLCIDKQGNESPFVSYTLKVSNSVDTDLPTISMTSPAGDYIVWSKTEKIDIKLNIKDNKPLEDGRVELSYLDPKGAEFTVDQTYFDALVGSDTNYQYQFSFSEFNSPLGKYIFLAKVYDQVGNLAEKQFIVIVK